MSYCINYCPKYNRVFLFCNYYVFKDTPLTISKLLNYYDQDFTNESSCVTLTLYKKLKNVVVKHFDTLQYKYILFDYMFLEYNFPFIRTNHQFYLRNLWGYIFCNVDVKINLNISIYPFYLMWHFFIMERVIVWILLFIWQFW